MTVRFTDAGIEMTAAEAARAAKWLSAGALVSLGTILVGLALYFTPLRQVGSAMMLFALIPTFLTIMPLALIRLAQAGVGGA